VLHHDVELYDIAELVPQEGREGLLMTRLPRAIREGLSERGSFASFFCAGAEIRLNLLGDRAVPLRCDQGSHGEGVDVGGEGLEPPTYWV
jgi:hypothetical protein